MIKKALHTDINKYKQMNRILKFKQKLSCYRKECCVIGSQENDVTGRKKIAQLRCFKHKYCLNGM